MAQQRMRFTDQFRYAVENCGVSRYRLSRELGIAQSILSRFVRGEAGVTLSRLDELAKHLGLNVTTGPPKLPKPRRNSKNKPKKPKDG